MTRPLVTLLTLGLLWLPSVAAHAADGQPAEAGGEVIKKRLYSMDGRFELAPSLGFSLNDKFTQHITFQASGIYHIAWGVAVELMGGYALGFETNLTDGIREGVDEGGRPLTENVASEVTDRNIMTWFVVGAAHWEPIYGKLSLFSDLDVRFGVYGILGAGVAGTEREPLCDGRLDDGSGRIINTRCQESKVTDLAPLLHFGGGFRFFFNNMFSLRFEIRNHTAFTTVKVEPRFTSDQKNSNEDIVEATDVTHYPLAIIGGGITF